MDALERGGWEGRRVGADAQGTLPPVLRATIASTSSKAGRPCWRPAGTACPFPDLVGAVFGKPVSQPRIPRRSLHSTPTGTPPGQGNTKEWNEGPRLRGAGGVRSRTHVGFRGGGQCSRPADWTPIRLQAAGWHGVGSGRAAWRDVLAQADECDRELPRLLWRASDPLGVAHPRVGRRWTPDKRPSAPRDTTERLAQ